MNSLLGKFGQKEYDRVAYLHINDIQELLFDSVIIEKVAPIRNTEYIKIKQKKNENPNIQRIGIGSLIHLSSYSTEVDM